MIETIKDRARGTLRLRSIRVQHRGPPRRIGDPAADLTPEIICQEACEIKLQPYRSASVVYIR